MAEKKYLDLAGLEQYDALIKERIEQGDSEKANVGDSYTKAESDGKYQAKGNYLTAVPSEYITETELAAKKYLTAVPSEYITETELDNKSYATTSQVNAKYTKPSTGIPKTDLASAVQASLNKADTALQSHQDISGKADKATTLSGYGITDAYTKTQVDGMVASAFHYKSTVASYSALPTTGQKIGDVYNITAADSSHNIKAGDNVVWNGSAWDVLSGVVDLSGYVTTTALDTHAANATHITSTERTNWNDANSKKHSHSNADVLNATTASFTTADRTKLDGIAASANNYSHPTGDGNKHVPATGTTNNGKFLKAGSTAGSMSWASLSKSDVGLGNVDNTSDANKPISTATQTALDAKANASDLTSHTGNKNNPHGVTAAQVGTYTTEQIDTKLAGKQNTLTIDTALSTTSTNPVQNKAVAAKINEHIGVTNDHNTRIGALETKVGDGFTEITSQEISSLFQ